MNPVTIVGMGMSVDDLTPAALELIYTARVLVGGERHLAELADAPGEKVRLTANLDTAFENIRERMADGGVVILASGDPLFYGIGARAVEELGAENVEILPNVTTFQAAFARLKMPWQDAALVSVHGRDSSGLREAAARADKLAVLTDRRNTPAEVARVLTEAGWTDARLCVLEDLGRDSERICWYGLTDVQAVEFSPLNVVIAVRESAQTAAPRLHLGMDESAYDHQAGLITKTEARVVALARLALGPDMTLWDVGAGCGSVSIEASLLMPGGSIVAIEKDPERLRQIETNRRRFGVPRYQVVDGIAPECLGDLPDPDRVFVGGGGPAIGSIIGECLKRLPPGGCIVITAVLLETFHMAVDALEKNGMEVEITQIQASRSHKMEQGTRLRAENPVWVIKGEKP